MDLPALTAGQVEQGKLVRGEGRSALERRPAAGRVQAAPGPLPLEPGPLVTCAHPVIHVLLGGGSQAHRPPLPGPLRRVEGEGVLSLIEHGDQHCHLVEEHMEVLFTEDGGQAVTRPEGDLGGWRHGGPLGGTAVEGQGRSGVPLAPESQS